MTRPEHPRDPNTLVAALSRDQVSLQLGTFDLCCLAGLYLRADRDALAGVDPFKRTPGDFPEGVQMSKHRHRPPYPAELKKQTVELIHAGRSPAELAEEFEPTAQAIRAWVRQAAIARNGDRHRLESAIAIVGIRKARRVSLWQDVRRVWMAARPIRRAAGAVPGSNGRDTAIEISRFRPRVRGGGRSRLPPRRAAATSRAVGPGSLLGLDVGSWSAD